VVGDLGDRAGELNPGRTAANDDEGQQRPPPLGVVRLLGLLESVQDPAPDVEGVVERLEARREGLPLVVAEVGVAGAGGDDQVVERQLALVEDHRLPLEVDVDDLGHHDPDVRLFAEDAADRLGDVRRREDRRRHLVEQRLEQVVVVTVDDDHLDRLLGQRLGRLQPGEAAADDDHLGEGFGVRDAVRRGGRNRG
jgi:hypothetical protein